MEMAVSKMGYSASYGTTSAIKCIARLPDGRVCGEPASYIDSDRGGIVCGDHTSPIAECIKEAERLNTLLTEHGIGDLIILVADEIVRLRRKVIKL